MQSIFMKSNQIANSEEKPTRTIPSLEGHYNVFYLFLFFCFLSKLKEIENSEEKKAGLTNAVLNIYESWIKSQLPLI